MRFIHSLPLLAVKSSKARQFRSDEGEKRRTAEETVKPKLMFHSFLLYYSWLWAAVAVAGGGGFSPFPPFLPAILPTHHPTSQPWQEQGYEVAQQIWGSDVPYFSDVLKILHEQFFHNHILLYIHIFPSQC